MEHLSGRISKDEAAVCYVAPLREAMDFRLDSRVVGLPVSSAGSTHFPARGAAGLGPRGRPGALVVGSYQGCSEGLHALTREVTEERARTEWRRMGARSEHEALGIFVHDVHPPPLGQRVLAVVGARHPRPPARHREAERRDPPPRPAARVRAWASGRGQGGAVAAGAPRHPAGDARRGGPVSGARRPRAGR